MKLKHLTSLCVKVSVIMSLFLLSYNTPTFANSASSANEGQAIATSDTGRYIVKFRKGSAAKAQSAAKEAGASVLNENKQHMVIKLNKSTEREALSLLAADPNVEYIEPDLLMRKSADVSDPAFPDQWGLPAIDAPEAWDQVTSTSKVVVAVIDTGVDYTHPDLVNRVDTVNDYDYVNSDSNAMDDEGHGTHVAGIIAAEANSQGTVGVAGKANVQILPLKALDATGSGYLSHIAQAVMYAADEGADIINMSLGAKGYSQTMEEAVNYAVAQGSVVIVAAGNETDNADLYTPASIPAAITVSAVNQSLTLASFSNFGSSIDIAAPGVDIVSDWINGKYMIADGTSQAAPMVSGVAALLKAQENLSSSQITSRLLATATDLGVSGRDNQYGYGLVNANKALTEKPQSVLEADITSVNLPTSVAEGQTFSGTVTVKNTGNETWSAANGIRLRLSGMNTEQLGSIPSGTNIAPGQTHTFSFTLTAPSQAGSYPLTLQMLKEGGASFGESQTVTISVTSSAPVEKPLSKIASSEKKVGLKPGESKQIAITAYYKDGTTADVTSEVAWSSQHPEVATVANGLVTAQGFGKTYIIAIYKGKTAKIPVDISVLKLVAGPTKLSLKPDAEQSIVLTATYGDKSTANVTELAEWKTSDARVATVVNGKVTAHEFGRAYITATYGKKTVKISVDIKLSKLTANPAKLSMKPDDVVSIDLTAYYGELSEVVTESAVWKSSNESIATVENGKVTARSFGSTSITATYRGKSVKIPVVIKLTKLTATPSKLPLKPGDSSDVAITAYYGQETQVVTEASEWKSSNSNVAVYEDGKIVAKGFGKATLTATYRGKSVKITVDTNLKKLTAEPTKLTLQAVEGDAIVTIKATYSNGSTEAVTDGIEWTTNNDAVASVDQNGVIIANAKGKATITAKYGNKTVKISVTVTE